MENDGNNLKVASVYYNKQLLSMERFEAKKIM
jgi:hypothetical protein